MIRGSNASPVRSSQPHLFVRLSLQVTGTVARQNRCDALSGHPLAMRGSARVLQSRETRDKMQVHSR